MLGAFKAELLSYCALVEAIMTSFEFFIDAVAMLLGVVLALILTSLTMILRKKPDGCYDD